VSKDGIHDILALEAAAKKNGDEDGSKKVWTFRRTDNLRLWAGYVLRDVSSVSKLTYADTF